MYGGLSGRGSSSRTEYPLKTVSFGLEAHSAQKTYLQRYRCHMYRLRSCRSCVRRHIQHGSLGVSVCQASAAVGNVEYVPAARTTLAQPPAGNWRPSLTNWHVLHFISPRTHLYVTLANNPPRLWHAGWASLSSVKKAPRDIFCCSFFFGATRH